MTWEIGTTIAANIATIVVAIGAIITLIYLKRQMEYMAEQTNNIAKQAEASVTLLHETRNKTKEERTFDFLQKFNDPEYTQHVNVAMRFLRDDKRSVHEKTRYLDEESEAAKELEKSINIVLNFFEILAIMYNRDLAHKELIISSIRTVSIKYYEQASWYIRRMRDKYHREAIYKEWEEMNIELARR